MKKITPWLILVVVLAVLLFLIGRHEKADHPKPVREPMGIALSNAAPRPEEKTVELERPININPATWLDMLDSRQRWLARNRPVVFSARVVDQSNQPVEGAELKLKLTRMDEAYLKSLDFFSGKSNVQVDVEYSLFSDQQGWIELKDVTGFIVAIHGLHKEGYVSNLPDGVFGSVSFEETGPHANVVGLLDSLIPAKGHTFHLWKKGETERVLPVKIGVNMDVEEQGQWVSNYFVRFVPARVEWTNFDGADLMIRGVRRLSGNENRPFEFTFTLAIPNGGLLISQDAYPYLAPSTGYRAIWSFENKPQNNPPDFPWTKTCYLKLRGGKMYAGVRMGFCSGTGFNFTFDGYLNPNGSRNLEPDPEKLTTDPEEIRRIDQQTRAR